MGLIKRMLASMGMVVASAATAMAAPIALLQDPQQPPVKVDVHTTETHTVWFADPMWIAVGAVVLLLIIVLAVLASRGRDNSTTVVR